MARVRTPEQKARSNEKRRERYATDPEKRKVISLQNRRARYGIDLIAELQRCGSCCESCGVPFTALGTQRADGTREPTGVHVDHDHEINEVRGLLCLNCNLMIGYGKDDPEKLRRGAEYLERCIAKRMVG